MVKYHIKLYPRAYRDMEEIYRYIAIEKQVPENAKAQTDRIWRAIKKLETFPGSHPSGPVPPVWTIAGNVVGSPVKCCQPWEWKKDLTRRLS